MNFRKFFRSFTCRMILSAGASALIAVATGYASELKTEIAAQSTNHYQVPSPSEISPTP